MIRHIRLKTPLLLLLSLLVSGCGAVLGPTDAEMTLQSQNDNLSTQIADLRSTATVDIDRMMVTVEHASTEVRAVAVQRDFLRATLIARSEDPAAVDAAIAGLSNLPAGIDPASLLPQQGQPIQPAPQVTPLGAGAPIGTPTLDPSLLVDVTPTPASGARLVSPVLTTGVDGNDCALNSTTAFTTTTPEIYIVATAQEFPAGTVMTARWSREGTVLGSYDIPFNFAIPNACVWAFIDQSDFAFDAGNWTVELLINGQPAIAPVAFTISAAQ